jgi:hypothetical protein
MILVCVRVERRSVGQAEIFAGPAAQVTQFAALAAKRPKGIVRRVHTGPAALGAHHGANRRRGGGVAHEHMVSSNDASSVAACSRASSPSRIMRTETISRLPLISGTNPVFGSSRRRNNWNVRPWGRFC